VQKEGPNEGRYFFCCSKPRDEQCQFFKWCENPNQFLQVKSNVSSTVAMMRSEVDENDKKLFYVQLERSSDGKAEEILSDLGCEFLSQRWYYTIDKTEEIVTVLRQIPGINLKTLEDPTKKMMANAKKQVTPKKTTKRKIVEEEESTYKKKARITLDNFFKKC
jgi:hypothetical protein